VSAVDDEELIERAREIVVQNWNAAVTLAVAVGFFLAGWAALWTFGGLLLLLAWMPASYWVASWCFGARIRRWAEARVYRTVSREKLLRLGREDWEDRNDPYEQW
jgi:hypothetical protein